MLANISVVAGPASYDLGARVAKRINADLIPVEAKVFSDGESKITFPKVTSRSCVIVQSTYPPVNKNLLEALMIIRKCVDDGAENVSAVVPYLGYARQDRAFLEGEFVTISLVARLFEAAGADLFLTVDVHSKLALSYFTINAKNISSIPLLAEYAANNLKLSQPVVVSPDAGGAGRAKDFADLLHSDVLVLKKSRDRNTGEVSISEQVDRSVTGRDIILVDDIISSGGSIIKSAQFLKRIGCGKIYALCAHGLLADGATNKIKQAGVEDVISTNSIPSESSKVDLSPGIAQHLISIL
jgi:ribose-phosphate pyrophosphokinase